MMVLLVFMLVVIMCSSLALIVGSNVLSNDNLRSEQQAYLTAKSGLELIIKDFEENGNKENYIIPFINNKGFDGKIENEDGTLNENLGSFKIIVEYKDDPSTKIVKVKSIGSFDNHSTEVYEYITMVEDAPPGNYSKAGMIAYIGDTTLPMTFNPDDVFDMYFMEEDKTATIPSSNSNFNNIITMGNLDAAGNNVNIKGDVVANRTVSVHNTVKFDKNIYSNEKIELTNPSVGGSVYCSGDIIINGGVVAGDIISNGNIILNGVTVKGNVLASNGYVKIGIGANNIQKDIIARDYVSIETGIVNGNIVSSTGYIICKADVRGNLTAKGDITLSGPVSGIVTSGGKVFIEAWNSYTIVVPNKDTDVIISNPFMEVDISENPLIKDQEIEIEIIDPTEDIQNLLDKYREEYKKPAVRMPEILNSYTSPMEIEPDEYGNYTFNNSGMIENLYIDGMWGTKTLKFDASSGDIDIRVTGTFSIQGCKIIVDDNNGNNKVRIFLDGDNANLNMDGAGNSMMHTNGEEYTIPEFYLFSNNVISKIYVGGDSVIKGYILAPNSDVDFSGHYKDKRGLYGMVMAGNLNVLPQANLIYYKYDESHDEKFNKAVSGILVAE